MFLSLSWAPKVSYDVPAEAGFLCDRPKSAAVGAARRKKKRPVLIPLARIVFAVPFPSSFPTKRLYEFFFSFMQATCAAHFLNSPVDEKNPPSKKIIFISFSIDNHTVGSRPHLPHWVFRTLTALKLKSAVLLQLSTTNTNYTHSYSILRCVCRLK